MGSFEAITPGTDLPRYARDLVRMHDAVIGGGRPPLRPRTVVARSWSRVLAAGLAPDRTNTRAILPLDEIEQRRRASPLQEVIGDLSRILTGVADSSQMMMVVADADGIVLWRSGAARVRGRADELGFREGATWTETTVGTNAIGTALAEAVPVQLFSGEHFEQSQHPWYCTAAPLHDPRTGDLLGVVDVSGPALTLHPTVTALVSAAVEIAQGQLLHRQHERLQRLRDSAMPTLAALRGPALIIDRHGWVAHATGVAPTRRIAIPNAQRAVQVPGLGLCSAEPLAEGWLLRPAATDTRIRMILDLSGAPLVRSIGGETDWHTPLSRRHAEILLLLHRRGRRGMSVTELSTAIHGDPDHAVAIRAELSRLRRILGSVIESRPYRISAAVEFRLELGECATLADCAFLRGAAPTLLRALTGDGPPVR
ncbi:diguanylate cyclase [Nocardia nova]|uniref:Diguanylate cyclase n=1 Tax=Nocardia nova TaxID=37330 RepID=A0A2S6AIZ7_9NOCA|nr:GAF domain-containing protein [Nocardia nova]PPJ31792.1 diguanylate cyclase [Nocardia nova]PPJ35198.1 diguanylate cyclase [Nocardia nova]